MNLRKAIVQAVARLRARWWPVTKTFQWPFDIVGRNDARQTDTMTRPYERSVWVSRAVKKVAGPIAAVPLRFSSDTRNGEVDLENPELDAFWSSPARGLSMFDFIEATVGWLNLSGEAFWVLDDTWLVPYPSNPSRILFVRPDKMREVIDVDELIGWEYLDAQNRKVTLLPEQVIQPKFWNPYNNWRGLAPWLAAECATEADWYACTFNRNLWKNNGDRGPYIIGRSGAVQDEQRQQIIDQLRAKRAAAGRGDFKPMFLTGDIEVQDPQVSTLDANAVATRLQNRHEIALAFGVPPSMFDVVASYSIGSASDRFMLIEETCMPLAEKIADHIEELSRRMLGEQNLYAWFDWDEHSVMQQVRSERIDSAMKLWQMGQPMRDINDYLKMGMKEYEGWEVGYLPFSVVAVGEDRHFNISLEKPDGASDEEIYGNNEPEENDDEDEEIALSFRALRHALAGCPTAVHRSETADPDEQAQVAELQANRPRREKQIWQSHMASRRKVERLYESKITRVLMTARGRTLAKLEELAGTKAINGVMTRAAETGVIFDEQQFNRELRTAMAVAAAFALQEAGQQLFEEMAELGQIIRDPWKTPPAEVIRFNRIRENKIVGVGKRLFKDINQVVEQGIKDGASPQETAKNIRKVFNDASKKRARVIARTETGSAYGQGRQLAMSASGAPYKQWIASNDAKTRLAHMQANGQTVPTNDPFIVGGESMMGPLDPKGSAGNVINCRCVAVPTHNPNPGFDT